LHHFDPDTCITLLKKIKRSLAPKGRTLWVEFVPDEDRTSPYMPAIFPFIMLGMTPNGDAFAAAELDGMGRAAGFNNVTVTPLSSSPESLVAFEQ
jgi:hypothetical protein